MIAGWTGVLVPAQAHNLNDAGSNPAPATKYKHAWVSKYGQRGRTVNPLTSVFKGSNPFPCTIRILPECWNADRHGLGPCALVTCECKSHLGYFWRARIIEVHPIRDRTGGILSGCKSSALRDFLLYFYLQIRVSYGGLA